jgi:hypothetical protein
VSCCCCCCRIQKSHFNPLLIFPLTQYKITFKNINFNCDCAMEHWWLKKFSTKLYFPSWVNWQTKFCTVQDGKLCTVLMVYGKWSTEHWIIYSSGKDEGAVTAITEEHTVLEIEWQGKKKDSMVSCFNFLLYIWQNIHLHKELFRLVNFLLLSGLLYMISERLMKMFYSWKYKAGKYHTDQR